MLNKVLKTFFYSIICYMFVKMKLRVGDIINYKDEKVTVLEDLGNEVVILHGDVNNLDEQTVRKIELTI